VTRVGLLLAAFVAAVGLRVVIGQPDVAPDVPAALVFAVALLVVALGAGTRVRLDLRAVVLGLGGLVLVCAPVALQHALSAQPLYGTQGFGRWAAAVVVVATAEEVFLRGALYEATAHVWGASAAVVLGAVCFAGLHVPLYGWHVLPLDLAVGLVLGGLRQGAGTAAAPAITHVGADLVGWFLR
jgi:membrane protease YdiL (CAAX protease family)